MQNSAAGASNRMLPVTAIAAFSLEMQSSFASARLAKPLMLG
jgi:hypothetical protein